MASSPKVCKSLMASTFEPKNTSSKMESSAAASSSSLLSSSSVSSTITSSDIAAADASSLLSSSPPPSTVSPCSSSDDHENDVPAASASAASASATAPTPPSDDDDDDVPSADTTASASTTSPPITHSPSSDSTAASASTTTSPSATTPPLTTDSPSSSLWSDLPRRLTTIAIGLPFVCKLLSKPITALLFFQVVHMLVCIEWINLDREQEQQHDNTTTETTTTTEQPNSKRRFPVTSTLFYCCCNWYLAYSNLLLSSSSSVSSSCVILSLCTIFFLASYSKHDILGIVFITIPFSAWYKLCLHPPTTAHILWVVWNCDNGALLFGRLYSALKSRSEKQKGSGQPKWLTNISPKKSVQGLLGAFFTGLLAHNLWPVVGIQLFPAVNVLSWHYGVIICILAIAGDLLESCIKRSCGVKDSNLGDATSKRTQLPGHGGILDRFDSSLLVVVFYYFYVQDWNIYV